MKISDILNETPLMGYETLSDNPSSKRGDPDAINKDAQSFEKRSSSFTDRRDRRLLTSEPTVKRLKNKFENTSEDFYFYMVNTKEARDFTEVGMVDRAWLEKNMPAIAPHIKDHEDGITVIFTNNKGDERVPMTPWIFAHRMAHAFGRYNKGGFSGGRDVYQYTETEREIYRVVSDILSENYGYHDINPKPGRISYNDPVVKKFFEAIGTFRSARDKKLRADFEFLHEIFAQYLITGSIKFNPVPKTISVRVPSTKYEGGYTKNLHFRGDMEEANDSIETLSRTLEYHVENMLSEAMNSIFVM